MLSTKMLLYSGNNPVNYAQSIQQGRPIRLEYLIFAISPVGGLCVYFNGQDEQSSKVFLPDFLTKLKKYDHHWFFYLQFLNRKTSFHNFNCESDFLFLASSSALPSDKRKWLQKIILTTGNVMLGFMAQTLQNPKPPLVPNVWKTQVGAYIKI